MKITILGSTGSIGTQALEVCRHMGYGVTAISGYNNDLLLERQCREFKPQSVWCSAEKYLCLKTRLADTDIKVVCGSDAVCEMAAESNCDMLLNSMLGISGLKPTLSAIGAGRRIALANKETLVAGGSLVMKAAADKQVKIIPVDSEHSAIFQCLEGRNKPKKILLTASGGSFFGKTRSQLENVTAKQALTHPNWNMGAKITVDSSTLMNKGLELIEAVHLFGVSPSQVQVIIHRESIIHSMVEFEDNCVIAELSHPDMRECIQYAFTYPERIKSLTPELDFFRLGSLSFFEPDEQTFTLLPLARRCIELGGNIPAALNGANETAVAAFLKGQITFTQIFDYVGEAVVRAEHLPSPTLRQILETDIAARQAVLALLQQKG